MARIIGLAIVALLLVAATPFPSPSPRNPQNSKPRDHQTNPQTIPSPARKSATVSAIPRLPAPATPSNASQEQSDNWRENAFGPSTWANWSLTVLAGLAAWIAIWTLRAINRQADIAERTISELERPWISIEPKYVEGSVKAGGSPLKVLFEVVNGGRSPALITSNKIAFIPVELATLPVEPNYGKMESGAPILLAAAAKHNSGMTTYLNAEASMDVLLQKRVVILYGVVLYRGTASEPSHRSWLPGSKAKSREHETRFCLIYEPPSAFQPTEFVLPATFRFGGPEAYNRYT